MIYFTQFIRPNGRRETISIERPTEIEAKAVELVALKWRFEAESIFDNVHLEAVRCDDEDHLLACSRIVRNGPNVVDAVDELILEAWAKRSDPIPEEQDFDPDSAS